MLYLGRRPGEGIVIDHKYLLIIATPCGSHIKASLYIKDEGEAQQINLPIKEPYAITDNIYVTFMGLSTYRNNTHSFASIGIDAPKEVNVVRCEIMNKERKPS